MLAVDGIEVYVGLRDIGSAHGLTNFPGGEYAPRYLLDDQCAHRALDGFPILQLRAVRRSLQWPDGISNAVGLVGNLGAARNFRVGCSGELSDLTNVLR